MSYNVEITKPPAEQTVHDVPSSRILIADDEYSVRYVLERALSPDRHQIDLAANGQEALNRLLRIRYDLVLLDLNMQPINGLQVFRAVKQRDANTVVIVLTGHGSMESAVEALRLGAFDYLMKPIAPDIIRIRVEQGLRERHRLLQYQRLLTQIDELQVTLRTMIGNDARHDERSANNRFLRSGPLILDRQQQIATLSSTVLDLTPSEFALLFCLVEAAPEPLDPLLLVSRALGYECDRSGAKDIIKWHIHQLRRKIEPNPAAPFFIKTARHRGYYWNGTE